MTVTVFAELCETLIVSETKGVRHETSRNLWSPLRCSPHWGFATPSAAATFDGDWNVQITSSNAAW
jgi:hypothetical protein